MAGKPGRSGGHNRKSLAEHQAAGTVRVARHLVPPVVQKDAAELQRAWKKFLRDLQKAKAKAGWAPLDEYVASVRSGAVPAGKYHRLACDRHWRDVARQGAPGFPYRLELDHVARFLVLVKHLQHYKGKWAGETIKLAPHQVFRLGSMVGWVHVETGLRRFRRSYHEIPRKNGKSLEAAIVALYITFFDGEGGAEGYCLHPKTRVLLADLSWKELEDVQVGDELLSVDGEISGFKKQRKMQRATVLGKVRSRRPALRITFTGGAEVICSPDHKWLAQSTGGNGFKWWEARELKPTYRISYIGEPWDAGRSWDAGYLSGLFDGEGYLHAPTAPNSAFRIGFSQKPGAVLDACGDALERCGFQFDDPRPHAGGTMELQLTGLYQCLRLLGSIKPRRLWARSRDVWEGKKFPSSTATIERIERIGYEDLIDIETSTGTFIAEGLVSHNCAATKKDQARIVWGDAAQLVKSSILRVGIEVFARSIFDPVTMSKLEPLGSDSDSTDGLNPSLIIQDEFHAYKDRKMIDVLETATGARDQPVDMRITTAGDDPVSPGGDEHNYACQVLEEVVDDESYFAFIAHADVEDLDGDRWLSEETARKANPNYGVSVKPDDLKALALKAKNQPAAAAAYQQKRLNVWVNTSAPWLSLEGWRKGQSTWTAESMHGEECWIGIDLSSKIDLTAVVMVFPPTSTRKKWRMIVRCLTPEDTLEERAHRDRAPYLLWKAAGYLQTNPGNRIDQEVVREIVGDAGKVFDVQQVGIDPWNAGNLEKDLHEDGFQVVEIPQTLQQMSAPAKDFEADVLDGLVDAGGNPLMAWCISNVVVQRDGKDNIYPVKKKSRGRIDPVIAALMGRKLAAIDADVKPPAFQMLVLGAK